MRTPPPLTLLAVLIVALVAFAMLRPIDHDESQYVAAAVLSAQGVLPYRDYAYLQGPLQPLLFAPLAWLFGGLAWPGLRIANALLGVVAVAASWRAMRVAGVRAEIAAACAALFACCDILLFSAGTARNDALPAAMMALALVPIVRTERGGTHGEGSRGRALLIGLLLAGAAAAKVSYALPALTYGLYALAVRRHRPGWVLLGALPATALVAGLWWLSPAGAMFGILTFPAAAPAEYYAATDRAWKLLATTKAIDLLKFLALGPALLALGIVAVRRPRRPELLDWLIVAGLIAAVVPSPIWRQYLLPILPALFVRLALLWQAASPRRALRVACMMFAVAGLTPSVVALAQAANGTATGMHEGAALRTALDNAGASGKVATLSPQFVPATGRPIDPRFATGPFYFRSRGLLPAQAEASLHLIGRERLDEAFAHAPPAAILVGGEGKWTSGNDSLDALLERWAVAHHWRRVPVASQRFRLYLPPQAAALSLPSISPE
jgi:hypothetical protein